MKTVLPILFIFLFTFGSRAQNLSYSTVIIQNQQLYTVAKPESLNIKGQIDAARH